MTRTKRSRPRLCFPAALALASTCFAAASARVAVVFERRLRAVEPLSRFPYRSLLFLSFTVLSSTLSPSIPFAEESSPLLPTASPFHFFCFFQPTSPTLWASYKNVSALFLCFFFLCLLSRICAFFFRALFFSFARRSVSLCCFVVAPSGGTAWFWGELPKNVGMMK